MDTEGKELAETFDAAKEYESAVISFVESPADSQVIQGMPGSLRSLMNSALSMFSCGGRVGGCVYAGEDRGVPDPVSSRGV